MCHGLRQLLLLVVGSHDWWTSREGLILFTAEAATLAAEYTIRLAPAPGKGGWSSAR